MPVSVTSKRRWPGVGAERTRLTWPCFCVLDCVAHQIEQDLPQAPRIAAHEARDLTGHDPLQGEPGPIRRLPLGVVHLAHELTDVEGDLVQLKLLCVDRGKVEEVLDERQQEAAVALDDVQQLKALSVAARLKLVGEAEDGGQRGAEFVADPRKEGRLRAARRLGGEHRLLQLTRPLFHEPLRSAVCLCELLVGEEELARALLEEALRFFPRRAFARREATRCVLRHAAARTTKRTR